MPGGASQSRITDNSFAFGGSQTQNFYQTQQSAFSRGKSHSLLFSIHHAFCSHNYVFFVESLKDELAKDMLEKYSDLLLETLQKKMT